VKGYGLGEAGEGKNISHQQKKLNEKELREYREKLHIPIPDEEVVDAPFYKPQSDAKELVYLMRARESLGGFLPERKTTSDTLVIPAETVFAGFTTGAKSPISTTMSFVRILSTLLRDKQMGSAIVPIIPDEARTFGMESFFMQYGIYSHLGQLYEPVDFETIIYYREAKNGQILEEGINEAGAMSSFIAAGTSYATHGKQTIPFYVYYSMFGFQRIGDLVWLAADMQTKGFLLGATAGRTTLNGEGLQHQDGHSLILASTIPTLKCYDPAFMYEIAIIIKHGLHEMYTDKKNVFYYLTLGNENYHQPPMPAGVEQGVLDGLYKFKPTTLKKRQTQAHIFGSGSIINAALDAQALLESQYDIAVDVWSATNYKLLRNDALKCDRYNMFNPEKEPKKSRLETILSAETGVFLAVSDNMRMVPDQIAKWVPGGLFTLGTDGFGRSDTRENLRRFFEVDKESIVIATLYKLALAGEIERSVVTQAMADLNIAANKIFPEWI